jgi:hypothetical protein
LQTPPPGLQPRSKPSPHCFLLRANHECWQPRQWSIRAPGFSNATAMFSDPQARQRTTGVGSSFRLPARVRARRSALRRRSAFGSSFMQMAEPGSTAHTTQKLSEFRGKQWFVLEVSGRGQTCVIAPREPESKLDHGFGFLLFFSGKALMPSAEPRRACQEGWTASFCSRSRIAGRPIGEQKSYIPQLSLPLWRQHAPLCSEDSLPRFGQRCAIAT